MRPLFPLLGAGAALLVSMVRPARGGELSCPPSELGTTTLDGLTDDWSDVDGVEVGSGDNDRSLRVKCTVEGDKMFLLFDVRDDYLVRTKSTRSGEDHLELALGGARVRLYPGDAAQLRTEILPPAAARGWRAASALQAHGWAVELAVPLERIPGFRPGAPQVPFKVTFADCDSKAALKTEATIAFTGPIAFVAGTTALDSFLSGVKLTRSDIYWDQPVALAHKSGGRMVMAGRYLAAITDAYTYIELPFAGRKDLKDARLVDLAGDGRQALAVRYVERDDTSQREVLAVFRAVGDEEIRRVFAAEVGKRVGAQTLTTRVSFVRRKRATDLVLEPEPPVGFTQANYHESEATDMIPILLPWGDDRRAVYQFSGDEYLRAH
jgi:hypothetical protein